MEQSLRIIERIDDLEQEAARFLCQYGFEEAISTPMAVPIEQIAKVMSLQIIDTYSLSTDHSIQGAITFADGSLTVYDQNGNPHNQSYTNGTVFIDASINNIGRKRNTLAHECFHWDKHRSYFLNQIDRVAHKGIALRCEFDKVSRRKDHEKYTSSDWAEWQARHMAPRILMPKPAVQNYLQQIHSDTLSFEEVLRRITDMFQVSRHSACIRLKKMGYPGASEYYATNFESFHRIDKTRVLSKEAALQLFLYNDKFRELLQTGTYCHTEEGYLVKKDSQYIANYNNSFSMTDYGGSHLSECTLAPGDIFCDKEDDDNVFYRRDPGTWETFSTSILSAGQDKCSNVMNAWLQKKRPAFTSAGAEIWKIIEELNWDESIFKSETNLSRNRYYDFRRNAKNAEKKNSDPTYVVDEKGYDLKTLLSAGFGLKLGLSDMKAILELTDFGLHRSNIQHRAYEFCFDYCRKYTINECNAILAGAGMDTFAKSEDEATHSV